MSSDSWPPKLKDWVARCLGQMTDSNRTEAQAELRQVIADAFEKKQLWTTDWAGVQLQSLNPKPLNLGGLKRKVNDFPPSNKKSKKAANKHSASFDANDQLALNRRAQRFQREHEIERMKNMNIASPPPYSQVTQNNSRSPLFMDDEPEANPNVPDWDRFTIVGTSQEIFKEYLRLTSEPKPEQIRPYPVLQKALHELKRRWREKTPYHWICSQFKSLRQDLTVQRIKNEFTVQVYEIHGRMALECNDMVEYNSCQAMLKTLYEMGLPGKVEEFTAYRILMLIHGRNKSEMNLFVGQLNPKQKADRAVRHALDVQRALSIGNYHAFFELYLNAPNMGAYIMDHFIDRERVKSLLVMTKAYITLPLSFIQRELAFDTPKEAHEFLETHSANHFSDVLKPDSQKQLDCKVAAPNLGRIFGEKYQKVGIKGAI